jgi:recombination DNA repair RAD52 pathway protein
MAGRFAGEITETPEGANFPKLKPRNEKYVGLKGAMKAFGRILYNDKYSSEYIVTVTKTVQNQVKMRYKSIFRLFKK